MAEEKNSSSSEALARGASAANTIHGAAKAGKAIAAASKGAAAGPYGAVAGALWANRKHLSKIAIIISALLVIPILIVMMLPLMIFSTIGGFFDSLLDGSEVPDIMNNTAAIIENIETITSSLNQIMLEALDDLYARIDDDFAKSDGDRKEVVNPNEGGYFLDPLLIITQFSALNADGIENLTLDELERIMREHKGSLFSFTKRTEIIDLTITDPDTGEETPQTTIDPETDEEITLTETVIHYTVVYNGDAHFADEVFFLSDEQKALASDYHANLSAFLWGHLIISESVEPGVQGMVNIALAQVGYHERNADGSIGNGNFTKFGAWYGMNGQPWCAMFVSWAANEAGILNTVVPRHASTSAGVNLYRQRGMFVPRMSGYLPSVGDAIYFTDSSGSIAHVGLVVAYDPQNRRVHTVEGNTSNQVRVRHYDISTPRIYGYGRNGGAGFGTIPNNSSSGIGAGIT